MLFKCIIISLPLWAMMYWICDSIQARRYNTTFHKLLLVQMAILGFVDLSFGSLILSGKAEPCLICMETIDAFVTLSLGPVIYLNMKITTYCGKVRWYDYLWFLPAMVVGGFYTVTLLTVGPDEMLEYALNSDRVLSASGEWGFWRIYQFVTEKLYDWSMAVIFTFLGFLTVLYLHRYKTRVEDFYANVENKSVRYMRNTLICSGVLVMFGLVFISETWHFFAENMVMAYLFSISLAVVEFGLFYHATKITFTVEDLDAADQNAEEAEGVEAESVGAYVRPHIDVEMIGKALGRWLEREDRPYLAYGLNITTVAHDVKVPKNNLSQYINSVCGKNFNMWINTYKMEEAKRLLVDEKDYTMSYIAECCGVTDAAALTRLFNKIVGMNPSEYRKMNKK